MLVRLNIRLLDVALTFSRLWLSSLLHDKGDENGGVPGGGRAVVVACAATSGWCASVSNWGGPYIVCLSLERSNAGARRIEGELQIELVRGEYTGALELSVLLEDPDGVASKLTGAPEVRGCDGPAGPGIAYQPVNFEPAQPGTYWLCVQSGEQILSKIPIAV